MSFVMLMLEGSFLSHTDIVFLTLLISIAPLFSIWALLCLFIVSVHNVGAYTVNRTTTSLSSFVSFINPNASLNESISLVSCFIFSTLSFLPPTAYLDSTIRRIALTIITRNYGNSCPQNNTVDLLFTTLIINGYMLGELTKPLHRFKIKPMT